MKYSLMPKRGSDLFIRYYILIILLSCMGTIIVSSCRQLSGTSLKIEHTDNNLTVVNIDKPQSLLLLPVQESADEAVLQIRVGGVLLQTLDVRLAVDGMDYCVPFNLDFRDDTGKPIEQLNITIQGPGRNAIAWKEMKLADTFDVANREKFRPLYHHTPLYGWMNDPNGLVYKDGEYHLYYQYNPYGSLWGNMHWGHSVSKDLIHWEHKAAVLDRDTMGHIFSGSSVVDTDNTSGCGAGSILAFYTSASDENGQIQCMAYSTDNGHTFIKYEGNPVLRPFDGLRDFRDPKVFWYQPEQKWVMIVSADKEMRFYSSQNLKDWDYMSAWGDGYGVQPRQFECPDMIQLPVNGDRNNMKWVMIVNVNPGCYFGGSATQYFVGDFDGTNFTCDSPKETVKWLDWGKDHYAAVCFSNTGDRVIAVPWMSNWQYANQVPTMQFRSANALPRELGLYTEDNELFVSVAPVEEVKVLRNETRDIPSFGVETYYHIDKLLDNNQGAYELEVHFADIEADVLGFKLFNEKGQEVDIYFNMFEQKLVMDRTKSGMTDFGYKSVPHALESHNKRIETSINYVNDFALATWGPVKKAREHVLNVFVDKCSVEIFLDGGKLAMTNLIFPEEPYNRMSFYAKGGSYRIDGCKIYRLDAEL